jgi:hypothetical protein
VIGTPSAFVLQVAAVHCSATFFFPIYVICNLQLLIPIVERIRIASPAS